MSNSVDQVRPLSRPKQIAQKFGWSEWQVLKLVKNNQLRHSRLNGRIYISEEAALEFLNSIEVPPTKDRALS